MVRIHRLQQSDVVDQPIEDFLFELIVNDLKFNCRPHLKSVLVNRGAILFRVHLQGLHFTHDIIQASRCNRIQSACIRLAIVAVGPDGISLWTFVENLAEVFRIHCSTFGVLGFSISVMEREVPAFFDYLVKFWEICTVFRANLLSLGICCRFFFDMYVL